MPYNAGDIVKIELHQLYEEQGLINSLFYKIAEIVAGAVVQKVWDDLIASIISVLRTIQSGSLDHTEQVIYNLTDGVSIDNVNDTRSGLDIVGQNSPSFVSIGLKKVVDTRVTRPGAIRIAGIKQDNYNGNILEASFLADCNTVGDFLGDTQTIDDGAGNIVTFEPVVIGRTLTGAYDLTKINPVFTFALPRITTQNSRKKPTT